MENLPNFEASSDDSDFDPLLREKKKRKKAQQDADAWDLQQEDLQEDIKAA